MKIIEDIANPEQASKYLSHGWAVNSQGAKLLWLPILRLIEQYQMMQIRNSHGITKQLSSKVCFEVQAFRGTIYHFALALRELQKCIRIGTAHVSFDDTNIEERVESYEASSLVPLFTDLSFIYLRRIADQFAMTSRHVLFKKSGSAPAKYKDLRLLVASNDKLSRLEPICDPDLLQRAFASHSGWLDRLRDSNDVDGKIQKGIRDIMEHFGVSVSISHQKAGDDPWRISASLGHPSIAPDSYRPQLIETLKEIIKELSSFWTTVCEAAGLPQKTVGVYATCIDRLSLTGLDDDIIGFWPEK